MADAAATRIARGIVANLAGLAARLAAQFATLPIFFAFWSSERVGGWMLIFALPAYFALVANGFAAAGGNLALTAAQEGRMGQARRDFRAAWAIASAGTGLLCGLLVLCAAWLPRELGLPVDAREWPETLGWLALYVFAAAQMAVLDIPFRVAGRYPDHVLLSAAASLSEIVAIAISVTASESFAQLAMMLALFRVGFLALAGVIARRKAPEMFRRGADRAPGKGRLREMWRPSLAFMLLPLIFGLNIQGYTILVGAAYGALALAGFAATRVLARLIDLFANIAFAMQFYESGYLGTDRKALQRRLIATMTAAALVVSGLFLLGLMLFGPWLQGLLTVGQTRFDRWVALALGLAGMVRAVVSSPSAVLAAANRNAGFTVTYLVGSLLALLAATLLAFGGAPLAVVCAMLILAELSQAIPAFRRALDQLDYPARRLLRDLFARERLDDVGMIVRKLFQPRPEPR